MMQDKKATNTFSRILDEGNTLLEAGIIEEALQLRLTISESTENKDVYVGEIKNIEEYQKLKEHFEGLSDAMEWISEPKNLKLDLTEISVTIIYKIGSKTAVELAKIKLQKEEHKQHEDFDSNKLDELESLIDICNSKNDLSNDQIKKNFEILANQIIELKSQQKRGNDELKDELFVKINQKCDGRKKQLSDFEEKCSLEIIELKKEINQSFLSQTTDFEKLSKTVTEKSEICQKFQIFVKNRTNELHNQVRQINSLLNEKIMQIESLSNQNLSQSQKLQNIPQNMQFLSVSINQQKQKQTLKVEFYKQQKRSNKFKFNGKNLLLIQKSNVSTQFQDKFVFYEFVPFDKQFTFKVKIVKSSNNVINIGIVDYEKQKQKNSFQTSCYFGKSRDFCPLGFRCSKVVDVDVGETVEVRVNRRNKIIKWMVNNIQIASSVHKMLGDEKRKFMPYVEMYQIGDRIEYSL